MDAFFSALALGVVIIASGASHLKFVNWAGGPEIAESSFVNCARLIGRELYNVTVSQPTPIDSTLLTANDVLPDISCGDNSSENLLQLKAAINAMLPAAIWWDKTPVREHDVLVEIRRWGCHLFRPWHSQKMFLKPDDLCWRSAAIDEEDFKESVGNDFAVAISRWLDVNKHPWALRIDNSLSVQECSFRSLFGVLSRSLHFRELITHYIALTPNGNQGAHSDDSRKSRKNDVCDEPGIAAACWLRNDIDFIGPIARWGLSALFLILACRLIWIGLGSRDWRWFALCIFLGFLAIEVPVAIVGNWIFRASGQ